MPLLQNAQGELQWFEDIPGVQGPAMLGYRDDGQTRLTEQEYRDIAAPITERRDAQSNGIDILNGPPTAADWANDPGLQRFFQNAYQLPDGRWARPVQDAVSQATYLNQQYSPGDAITRFVDRGGGVGLLPLFLAGGLGLAGAAGAAGGGAGALSGIETPLSQLGSVGAAPGILSEGAGFLPAAAEGAGSALPFGSGIADYLSASAGVPVDLGAGVGAATAPGFLGSGLSGAMDYLGASAAGAGAGAGIGSALSNLPPTPPTPGGGNPGVNSGGPGDAGAFDQGGASGTGIPGTGPASSLAQGLSGAASPGSALSRILDGTATTADYLSLLGQAGATGLGLLGSQAQTNAYRDVYNQQMGLGAPSRARYEASFAPGFNLQTADPAIQPALDTATQSVLRGISAQTGANPFGNPGALAEAQKYVYGSTLLPQLNTYRSQNLTGGQLGTNTAGTASLAGAGQAGGIYDALGGGLGLLTQPQNDVQSLLRQLQGYGLNVGRTLT